MELEWDEEKRQRTIRERGIDFADVQQMDMRTARTVEDIRKDYDERRYVTLGFINDRLHVLCWTFRDSRMRIISLRKANEREQEAFAKAYR